jgi:hypothetical protein
MKWEKRTNILRLEEKFVRRGRLEWLGGRRK